MKRNNRAIYLILGFFFLGCTPVKVKFEECSECLIDSSIDYIHFTTISEFPECSFMNIHELKTTEFKSTDDFIFLMFKPGIGDSELLIKIEMDKSSNECRCFIKLYNGEWEELTIEPDGARLVFSKIGEGQFRVGGYFETTMMMKSPGYEKEIRSRNIISFLVTIRNEITSHLDDNQLNSPDREMPDYGIHHGISLWK